MLMPSIFGENLFDDFFNDFRRPVKRQVIPAQQVMRTDILEKEDGYSLDIDLPGYAKEDVQAELKDGCLTITAKKDENKEEKSEDGNYIRKERYYGSCSRSFYVGEEVTQEDIKAKFNNGTLNIFVPKIEPVPEVPESKFIAIEG